MFPDYRLFHRVKRAACHIQSRHRCKAVNAAFATVKNAAVRIQRAERARRLWRYRQENWTDETPRSAKTRIPRSASER